MDFFTKMMRWNSVDSEVLLYEKLLEIQEASVNHHLFNPGFYHMGRWTIPETDPWGCPKTEYPQNGIVQNGIFPVKTAFFIHYIGYPPFLRPHPQCYWKQWPI